MTSHDEQAFLNAIIAAPDDDTPRLVFADWLDERGTDDDRARAALIRAQCRVEILPWDSKERKKLEREEKAILKAHAKRWTEALCAAKIGSDFVFRRGFLDGITMTPTDFVEHGAELFRLAPTLRTARFPHAQSEVTPLAGSPFLARLATVDLDLMCTCGLCPIDVELRNLFASKHAKNLRHLCVSRDRVTVREVRVLAGSASLANLTSLDLSNNPLGTDGATAFAKSKHLSNLTTLNLNHTALGVPGVRELAKAKHLPALRQLILGGNDIGPLGVEALVAAPFFGQLTTLDLSGNRITEVGAKALAAAEAAKPELGVVLQECKLGQRAIKLLTERFGEKVKV